MNKIVSIGFEGILTVIDFLAGIAIYAFSILPGVLDTLVLDVSLLAGEGIAKTVRAVGGFGAIYASSAKQAGELCDGDAVELLGEDVVDARLFVGDLLC